MIRFNQPTCGDLAAASQLEWLQTNGLGGFASSTITGLNTRRYHGLLTAAIRPPAGRMVLLSKMEETLIVGGQHFDLATNQYPGTIYPQGHRYLQEFRLDPFPTFVYSVAGITIEKRLFMVQGENTTVVEYEISSADPARECLLELRPLIAFRDYHGTTHHNDALNRAVQMEPGAASIAPYAGLPALHFAHNASSCEETGNWYFNFQYAVETQRGLDDSEDLFNPLVLRFPVTAASRTATVIASTIAHNVTEAPTFLAAELARRQKVIADAPACGPHMQTAWSEMLTPSPLMQDLLHSLTAAADQFLVQRGQLNTIIAGYHWFADWGRDTMIALPGLTLMTGRPEVARNILQAFVDSANQGMLPNRFTDATAAGGDQPEFNPIDYNTADATLWLFEAVRSYLHYTGDTAFVRDRLYKKLKEMIDWHMRGTRFGIHASDDGMLWAGEPGIQLTWMDAKIGDWVVTPRTGKPVEIQALWYNAICIIRDLAAQFDDADLSVYLREYADLIKQSFNAQFWNGQARCLYDVVTGDSAGNHGVNQGVNQRDESIRPNQIFAVSLHHRMLSQERELAVIDVVERDLLTPLGLRTLSPHDPAYRPHYEGGVRDRDSAYHQGTVWPWLMGPFIAAYTKVHGRSHKARLRGERWLLPFIEHLNTAGLGQISEILDGDEPHTPRGCIAQAWSVAELLRAAVENVYQIPVSYQAAGKIEAAAGVAP